MPINLLKMVICLIDWVIVICLYRLEVIRLNSVYLFSIDILFLSFIYLPSIGLLLKPNF